MQTSILSGLYTEKVTEKRRDSAFCKALFISTDVIEHLLPAGHWCGCCNGRLGFPKATTSNLAPIPLSRRVGSMLQGDPTRRRASNQLRASIFGAGRMEGEGGPASAGFERPAARSSGDAAATLVQFGGESGPVLQEVLAGKPAVQPTMASICLSKCSWQVESEHRPGGQSSCAF